MKKNRPVIGFKPVADEELDEPTEQNTERTEKNAPLLSDLSQQAAIRRCGELKIDKQQVPLLLANRLNRQQQTELLANLLKPGSEQYTWYEQGAAEGEYKTAAELEAQVGNPMAKDAYKNFAFERRRAKIDSSLKKNFGIGEDGE